MVGLAGPGTRPNERPPLIDVKVLAPGCVLVAHDIASSKLVLSLRRRFSFAQDRTQQRVAARLPMSGSGGEGIREMIAWCHDMDQRARIGLNVILGDGGQLVGTRWGTLCTT